MYETKSITTMETKLWRVNWDNNLMKYAYRVGHAGFYDLKTNQC